MPDKPEISASVDLDTSAYVRSIRQGIRAADEFDAALAALVDEANDAEKAIQKLDSDIKLEIDTNLSSLLDADRLIQGLETTINPLVDIQFANDSVARQLLDDFNSTLTPRIDVETSELEQAQQLLDKLNASVTADVRVESSEVDTVKRKIDDLDSETIDTRVNADDSELGDIKKQLEDLKALAVIDLVLKLPEMIPGLEDLPLLNTINDQDKAERIITAGTGGSENADFYAAESEQVYQDNFGADRQETAKAYTAVVTQIADETGKLATTGENLGVVTEQAFTTATNTGSDFNEVLLAANQLVENGLAPSYEAAFDMINQGFAEGLNSSGDFLETITEYTPYFAKAKFSAEEMFSTFKTGTDAGIRNLDLIGDLVKELDIRLQSAASGEGVEFDAFKAAGLADLPKAYVAGQATGAEALKGLMDAWEAGTIDPQVLFDALGTQAEDITIPVVVKLDPMQVKDEFAQYAGTTMEVSAQLGGDLESSWATFRRTVESELATSVSNAFDIPGKIQQFSDGVSKFSALLDAGANIPEAIEIAFQVPGFADTVNYLASALGNLGITVMDVAARLLDAIGQGDAAGVVRGQMADSAAGQLAFDLKLNPESEETVRAMVATAINRGVSGSDLQSALTTAQAELIAAGDLAGAQALADAAVTLSTVEFPPDVMTFLTGQGIDPTNLDAAKTALQDYQDTLTSVGGLQFSNATGPGAVNVADSLAAIDTAAVAKAAATPLVANINTELNTQLNDMFATGNYLGAFKLAQDNDIQDVVVTLYDQLAAQMTELSNSGYLQDQAQALRIADVLNEGETEAAITEGLQGIFDSALAAGNFVIAGEVAKILGTDELIAELDSAKQQASLSYEAMAASAAAQMPVMSDSIMAGADVIDQQLLGVQTGFSNSQTAFTAMTTQAATDTASMGTSLTTLSGGVDAFAGNADYQFGEVTVGALDSADVKMLAFGITVTNTMLQANADVQGLIDKLLSIGGLDIALPPIGGGGGGEGPGGLPPIPGQSVGGSIEAGTLAKVHAEELLFAGEQDVSVLNRQTSAVIENALTGLLGGGGGGGNVTNVYNYNNVVVNTHGAAATAAAMDSKSIRGF